LFAAASGLAFVAPGCGAASCEDKNTCGEPDDGGSKNDGSIDAGGDALPGCDATKAPNEAPCVIGDPLGVFVDGAKGADTNPGTKAAPFKTIGAALDAAKGKRVYVCATSTYPETLTIDAAHDGAKVYGGFSECSTWTYDTSKKALVKPMKGLALAVKGLNL